MSRKTLTSISGLLAGYVCFRKDYERSQNEANESAASGEAIYCLLAALSGNDDLEQLFSDMAQEVEPKQPVISSSLSNCTMSTGPPEPSSLIFDGGPWRIGCEFRSLFQIRVAPWKTPRPPRFSSSAALLQSSIPTYVLPE